MGEFLNLAGSIAKQLSVGDLSTTAAQLAGVLLPNLLPRSVPEDPAAAASAFGEAHVEAKLAEYFGKAVDGVLKDKALKDNLPSKVTDAFENYAVKHRSNKIAAGDLDKLFSDIQTARAGVASTQPTKTTIFTVLEPIFKVAREVHSRGGSSSSPAATNAAAVGSAVAGLLSSLINEDTSGTVTPPPWSSLPLLGVLGGGAVEGTLPGGFSTFATLMPLLPEVVKHAPAIIQAARALQR